MGHISKQVSLLSLSLLLLVSHYSVLGQNKLETMVQRGHTRAVLSVCFSPDGKILASGGEDKSIKIWEFATGRELLSLNGHSSSVNDLLFMPEGNRLISAGRDGQILFWSLPQGRIVNKISLPNENIVSLAVSAKGDQLAVGTTDRKVRLYDMSDNSVLFEWKVDPGQYGSHVVFNKTGSLLAVGNDNRTVVLYDVQTGKEVSRLNEEKGFCGGCYGRAAFTADGQLIFGSRGAPMGLRSPSNENILTFLPKAAKNYLSMEIHNGLKQLVTVDEDSAVVWDLRDGHYLFSLRPDQKESNPRYGLGLLSLVPKRSSDQFNSATFSPDGKWIATGDNSNLVTIWNARTGRKVSVFYGYLSIPSDDGLNFDPNSYWQGYAYDLVSLKNDIHISPDGKYAYRAKIGFEARKWELATGRIVQTYFGHSKGVICLALSKDGTRLVTGSADHTARVWDTDTGKTLTILRGHRSFIYDVDFSPDQKKVLTSSVDGTIKIWDAKTGDLLKTIVLSEDPSKIKIGYMARFSPNGLYVFVGFTDGSLKMIEPDTGRVFREFIGHTGVTMDLAFSSSGRTVYSTGWDNTVRSWDVATGIMKSRFSGHSEPVNAVALSPDEKYLATAGTGHVILLRKAPFSGQFERLEGHKSIITALEFTQDGHYLVSGSIDGITKIWDVESGSEVLTHYAIGSSDWLITNRDGYFTGTDGAQKQVFFVKGMESYSLDRFFDTYYAPNKFKTLTIENYNHKQSLLERLQSFPPPTIEMMTPRDGEEEASSAAQVLVKIKNEGGGIGSVKLIQNGKVLEERKEDKFGNVKSKSSIIQKFDLHLIPGLNSIKVIATNKNAIESRPSEAVVSYESRDNQVVCYVLAIGINTYKNPAMNLNYAFNDATGFADEVKEVSEPIFDRVEVHKVLNKEATKSNILGILDALAQRVHPGDVFYFYYAGHGTMMDDVFYFVPTENTRLYSSEKLKKDGISALELQEKFKKISALKQLVLIDACQSGGSAELLATRGAKEEKALAHLSRATGIHVLSAAGSQQFATEYRELGHGLFTYVLLEALKGKADGAPHDGTVTIYELKSYIDTMVPEYSQKYKGKVQYPYTFSRGQDFPVSVVK